MQSQPSTERIWPQKVEGREREGWGRTLEKWELDREVLDDGLDDDVGGFGDVAQVDPAGDAREHQVHVGVGGCLRHQLLCHLCGHDGAGQRGSEWQWVVVLGGGIEW